jgi:hypothetical protein
MERKGAKMSELSMEVEGTLHSDGTLELDEKPTLPPGRVKVVLQTLPQPTGKQDPLGVLQAIWADQKARGYQPRSVEEIDAALNQMRDEWEEHQKSLEELQKLP